MHPSNMVIHFISSDQYFNSSVMGVRFYLYGEIIFCHQKNKGKNQESHVAKIHTFASFDCAFCTVRLDSKLTNTQPVYI